MQRAAEFDFALDVDDLSGSHPDACRDAHGPAECIAAHGQDAEPIDLPHLCGAGVDQHDVALDHLEVLKLCALVTLLPGRKCALHVCDLDDLVSCFGGPEVGLAQVVGKVAHAQRQLAGVLGLAR